MADANTPSRGKHSWIGTVDALSWLQVLCTAIALLFCFQGKGIHFWWILLAFGVPLLRVALQVSYRDRLVGFVRRLWHQIQAYPGQDSNIPWLPVFVLVVLPTALISLSGNHGCVAGDSRPVVLSAVSLVTQGDLDLTWYFESVERTRGVSLHDLMATNTFAIYTPRGIHSSYPAGMLTFAVPVVATARVLGADLREVQVHWRLEKWTASWVAGACLGLFFLLSLHLVEAGPALAATAVLATGSVIFSTVGQALWQHGGVIFWGLTALLLEFRFAAGVRPGNTTAVFQGLALGQLLVCRLSTALFILPFGVWILLRQPRRSVVVAAFGIIGYLPWALLNLSIYGTLFGPSAGQMSSSFWTLGLGVPLAGILVSPARGLLIYQPWILLAGAALVLGWWRKPAGCERIATPPGWTVFCATVIGLHLALISCWGCWWGGGCWGSRLAADIVPLCALLCLLRPIAILWPSVSGRLVVLLIAVVSFGMHAPGVYLSGERWNYTSTEASMWSWSDSPVLYPFRHAAVKEATQDRLTATR